MTRSTVSSPSVWGIPSRMNSFSSVWFLMFLGGRSRGDQRQGSMKVQAVKDTIPIHSSSLWIQKEINPQYSLEGLLLKLKSFGHLIWRANSLEKTLVLGKIEGKRRGWQTVRWLDIINDSIDLNLNKFWEIVEEPGMLQSMGWHKSQTWLSDTNNYNLCLNIKMMLKLIRNSTKNTEGLRSTFLVAQWYWIHVQCRRSGRLKFNPCVWKIPWRRKWQPIPVFLLRKSPPHTEA